MGVQRKTQRQRKQHIRVDKASLGELLEYCRLTALKPGLRLPIARASLLTFVTPSGCATVSRALTSPDTFLLSKCQLDCNHTP